MKRCSNCKTRETCTRICPEVERALPREETGANPHREVSMSREDFEAVVERYSFSEWTHEETVSKCPQADLSGLTSKEKQAFLLLASGCTMRAAARRLRITLKSLQKRVNTGRKRLLGRHPSHLMRDENREGTNG